MKFRSCCGTRAKGNKMLRLITAAVIGVVLVYGPSTQANEWDAWAKEATGISEIALARVSTVNRNRAKLCPRQSDVVTEKSCNAAFDAVVAELQSLAASYKAKAASAKLDTTKRTQLLQILPAVKELNEMAAKTVVRANAIIALFTLLTTEQKASALENKK